MRGTESQNCWAWKGEVRDGSLCCISFWHLGLLWNFLLQNSMGRVMPDGPWGNCTPQGKGWAMEIYSSHSSALSWQDRPVLWDPWGIAVYTVLE